MILLLRLNTVICISAGQLASFTHTHHHQIEQYLELCSILSVEICMNKEEIRPEFGKMVQFMV